MGKKARDFAQGYDWEKITALMEKVYAEIARR
jgi:hypothetical protein